jgi:hypothetical protein
LPSHCTKTATVKCLEMPIGAFCFHLFRVQYSSGR